MAEVHLDPTHLKRLQDMFQHGSRVILGLVGAPGSGKSTIADWLVRHFAGQAQLLPMDGFHLAQVELERLGRAHRKGAPDTFDSEGFVALLARVRAQRDDIVYAPEFRREIEEPVAGAIALLADTPLIVVEGNYLLLDEGPWAKVRALLDEVWYIDVDDDLRRQRLVQRHMRFGRSEQAAKDWVASTDEPNARLIARGKPKADVVVHAL